MIDKKGFIIMATIRVDFKKIIGASMLVLGIVCHWSGMISATTNLLVINWLGIIVAVVGCVTILFSLIMLEI